eukprot:CAMPEP_0114515938 /NCGR_PEP_ID=MMETSP0109-20121206/17044_1 /TAXON_ID=29199 /ORGANISM="Chlorarachnion reptans, Strain CCCM449" /LENGTH=188 /DNA_ID=CAMNT_0001696259 /DNA_START=219 /DNA_END=785 /DNA_ORIENTATION=+
MTGRERLRRPCCQNVHGNLSPKEDTEGQLEISWKNFKGLLASEDRQRWYDALDDLRDYHRRHGDCALGYREDDDAALVEWVKEQRRLQLKGKLDRIQKAELDSLGFRWKADYFDDQAEWVGMFTDLKAYLETHGTLQISPISSPDNVRLMHWAHVQRELANGGVLPTKRRLMLEDIGFEFEGPAGSNH